MFRVGIGYDIHRLVEGRPLILGGVRVPFELGLTGHSDADVLVHALMDAVLGAMGLPDIGTFFPNTDEQYQDQSSLVLLEEVKNIMLGEKYLVLNLDTVIIAEAPVLSPYTAAMKDNLARVLGVANQRVGIKCTTSEGIGSLGSGKGVAAYAVVLLQAAV